MPPLFIHSDQFVMAVQVLFHNQPHKNIEVVLLLLVLDVQHIQLSEHFFDVVYHLLAHHLNQCSIQVQSHSFLHKVKLFTHYNEGLV